MTKEILNVYKYILPMCGTKSSINTLFDLLIPSKENLLLHKANPWRLEPNARDLFDDL